MAIMEELLGDEGQSQWEKESGIWRRAFRLCQKSE